MDRTNTFLDRSYFDNFGSRMLPILLVVLISIFPFAINGWWFDDTSISSTFWEVQIRGISLFQFLWEQILAWAKINGRLAPLAIIQTYGLHYWIQNVHLYRLLHVLLILVHLSTFTYLLRKLKYDWNFIGLWLLLWVGVVQVRDFHDPVASYGFFLQSQGILFTLSIIFLLIWSTNHRNKWLALSSILAIMAMLMYEINLVFYPIALGLIFVTAHPQKLKIRAMIIYLTPLFFYALLTILIRNSSDINYPGVKVGNPSLFLPTYGKQFIAAFPGVFYFFKWKTEYSISMIFTTFIYSPMAWTLMIASLYATFRCFSVNNLKQEKISPENKKLIIISLCLIFITPIFVAISMKYQFALTWGTGYLPVYYSYFGVALVFAASFSEIANRFTRFRLPIAMVVAILITSNFIVNRNVISKMDKVFVEPQTSLAKSLKDGLLDVLHDGNYLNIENPVYQFMNRGFFYRYSGKKVIIENDLIAGKADNSSDQYTLLRQTIPPYRWKIFTPTDVRAIFSEGWSIYEGAHRWSVSQQAVINLKNGSDKPVTVKVIFDLNTLKPRKIELAINEKPLDQLSSFLNGTPAHFEISPVILDPGENNLIIKTDVPPESPGKADSRKLSFLISNFFLIELE